MSAPPRGGRRFEPSRPGHEEGTFVRNHECYLSLFDMGPELRYHMGMGTSAIATKNEPDQTPAADRVRIVSTPGVCGGRPRIDCHRITVEDIAVWHERMGISPDEIVSSHPSITLSDVHAALAYY